MLNEVNCKLLMMFGVVEVFLWKWELVEYMVWFDVCLLDDFVGWEIFYNDLFLVFIVCVY